MTSNNQAPTTPAPKKGRRWLWVGFVVVVLALVGAAIWLAPNLRADLGFRHILLSLINIIFGLAAGVAFIALLVSGFIYALSANDITKLLRSRRTLVGSAVALVILLVAYGLIYFLLSGGPSKPNVGLIATMPSPATGSAPLEVAFELTRAADPTSLYTWDFGDGSDRGVGAKTRHTYQQPGIFKVLLNQTRTDGSTVTAESRVSVTSIRPATVIRASVTDGEAPLTVDFDGGESKVANGRIANYFWDFGDTNTKENTATGKSASHIFTAPGEYQVVLTTEDESGNRDSVRLPVKVLPAAGRPKANIVTTPVELEGNAPLTIRFNGSGSSDDNGIIQSYLWDFGDGARPEKTVRVEHTYQKPGEYEVSLKVADNESNVGEAKVKVVVYGEKKPPVAKIATEPAGTSGPVPYQVTFNGAKSSDEDGQIVSFAWDFGDNSPPETTPTALHSFTRVGQYEVKLAVTDNDGLKATAAVTIKVTEKKKLPPVAVITADVNSGITPLRVKFDAAQSYDQDGSIISYRWDFGDGTPPTQGAAQATHVYETVGIFTARVAVFDNDNQKGEASTAVAVNRQQPVAKIQVNPTQGKAPLSVLLDGQGSLGNITQYQWDLGDGAVQIGPRINHTYQQAGIYTVKLKITDPSNLTAEQTITITVTEN